MKTETSEVARQYRLREWAEMIKECNARPENMSVSEWCKEHSITTANYYYRLAEVRKALLKNAPGNSSTAIVPVPAEIMSLQKKTEVSESYVELISNNITIRVTNHTSTTLLTKVLEVVAHVK